MSRKKPSRYLLDITFTFEDTAVLMFRTSYMNYQFVMELNKAYGLELSRFYDIQLDNTEHPCFSYNDEYARLGYVMIDRSASGPSDRVFEYYDKMLLVRGRDSWAFQKMIYNDIVEGVPEPDDSDLLGHRRWVLANSFKQGIFGVDTFGFSRRQGNITSLYTGPAEKMPRPTATYLNRLRKFLENTFETLQWHLCSELYTDADQTSEDNSDCNLLPSATADL